MEQGKIVGIAGSPRNRISPNELLDILDRCDDFDALYDIIYKLGGDKKISNSEGILLAAMYGAKEMGLAVGHILLKEFFVKHKSLEKQKELLGLEIQQSAGLILSSPVYFGDRSSLIADTISRIQDSGGPLPLDGKAVGSIAVGAKRNGGQETTNVFALFDCISLGACVVGNGPPTSQYGGTAVGGGMGAIIDDAFGLKTSRGTGQRVALLARTMALDPAGTEDKFRIVFLVTRTDREGYFIDKIKNLPFSAATQVEVVDITQMKIARCRACSVCPNGNLKDAYTCVIPPLSGSGRRDDMQKIHRFMAPADIIILAHYNGPNAGVDHYQVFMERTRFIRRNQFELTNRVFSAFYETHCSPDIFTLRGLSSFLRHNMFLVGPFYCAFRQSGAICFESVDTKMYVARLETMARKARMARALGYNTIETSYLPVGYPGEKK